LSGFKPLILWFISGQLFPNFANKNHDKTLDMFNIHFSFFRTTLIFLFAFGLLAFSTGAQNKTGQDKVTNSDPEKDVHSNPADFPEATGWVNDFEEVLDSATEEKLTKLIVDHNLKTSNQISIVTISSIAPYDYMADYAKDLSNAWGVGEKGKNNGVTIIYSKALHEVRIVTGIGIENKLNDEMCQKVVDELMIPPFKKENYGKGLIDGVTELIRLLEK
jgi:uncharacterized protein